MLSSGGRCHGSRRHDCGGWGPRRCRTAGGRLARACGGRWCGLTRYRRLPAGSARHRGDGQGRRRYQHRRGPCPTQRGRRWCRLEWTDCGGNAESGQTEQDSGAHERERHNETEAEPRLPDLSSAALVRRTRIGPFGRLVVVHRRRCWPHVERSGDTPSGPLRSAPLDISILRLRLCARPFGATCREAG